MSGGTTGTPKGVLGKHGAYVITGLQVEAWTRSVLGNGDSVILLPLPLFHVYANVGVQGLAFVTGNPIALVPNPRDLPDLLATIRRVKPAFFNGVPTLYVALLNHPDVQRGKVDFKSIKICFSGAARADGRHQDAVRSDHRRPHRRRLLADRSDDGAVRQPGRRAEQDRVGRHAAARRRTCASSTATKARARLPAGEVGEICFSGAAADDRLLEPAGRNRRACFAIMSTTEARAGGCTPATSDTSTTTAICSSSIARRTSSRRAAIRCGRARSKRRSPSHPAVAEVGVAGVPDDDQGRSGASLGRAARRVRQSTEADLRAFCRERLAPYKVPARVEFRTDLPKTMVGKVLRRALKDHPAEPPERDLRPRFRIPGWRRSHGT